MEKNKVLLVLEQTYPYNFLKKEHRSIIIQFELKGSR